MFKYWERLTWNKIKSWTQLHSINTFLFPVLLEKSCLDDASCGVAHRGLGSTLQQAHIECLSSPPSLWGLQEEKHKNNTVFLIWHHGGKSLMFVHCAIFPKIYDWQIRKWHHFKIGYAVYVMVNIIAYCSVLQHQQSLVFRWIHLIFGVTKKLWFLITKHLRYLLFLFFGNMMLLEDLLIL